METEPLINTTSQEVVWRRYLENAGAKAKRKKRRAIRRAKLRAWEKNRKEEMVRELNPVTPSVRLDTRKRKNSYVPIDNAWVDRRLEELHDVYAKKVALAVDEAAAQFEFKKERKMSTATITVRKSSSSASGVKRPVGRLSGLGVGAAWCRLFRRNHKLKLTDVQLVKEMEKDFGARTFLAIYRPGVVRTLYNDGFYPQTEGAPKIKSVRYGPVYEVPPWGQVQNPRSSTNGTTGKLTKKGSKPGKAKASAGKRVVVAKRKPAVIRDEAEV